MELRENMEFMSRGREQEPAHVAPMPAHSGRRKHIDWDGKVVRIEWFVFTFLIALILLISIGWSIWSNNNIGYSESKQIDTTKYQAVFLNGGSTSGSVAYTTYFGHVTKLTDKYMILKNVYYLTTDQTSSGQATNPQLTKLGCQQLHSPTDQMVINRSQVAFWENLQDKGKVVTAIKDFNTKFPNGPDCSAANTNSGSSTTPNSSTSNTNTGNNNNSSNNR